MRLRKLLRCLSALLVALLGFSGSYARLDLVILPGTTPVVNQRYELELVVLNRGNTIARSPLFEADTLSVTLHPADGRERPALLQAASTAIEHVEPASFSTRKYTLQIPDGVSGPVTLEIPWQNRELVTLVELPQSSVLSSVAAEEPRPQAQATALIPAASALNRSFIERFEAHEPVYFIAGDEEPLAKFQFSFKYRMATLLHGTPNRLPTTIQLGYTQRSLWDLDAASSPFYDTSYMPEFFIERLGTIGDGRGRGRWLDWAGIRAGVRHESNGRDGAASRSLNAAYLRFAFHIGDPESWHMLISPEVFAYITEIDDNPLIDLYRYYGSLQLVFQHGDGISISLTGYPGKDFKHLTYQVDLQIPIRIGLLDHESYLLIQYFNGYTESLLDYDMETQTLRAGISLVR